MSYRRSFIDTDRHLKRWSYYGDTPHVPRGVDSAPAAFQPAPYNYQLTAPSRTRKPAAPIPKYNPWYTAYTPYYPTYYRGYSHMITSCKDYLNPGFMERDQEESTRVERHKELQQQEEERKKLIQETKSHYSRLVGQVPQIGVDKDSQRTDYGRLARYLSTYGSGNTTNLLRFLESGCTKEPIAVEVPKHVDQREEEEDDDDDDDGWVKAPIKRGFVKAGAPPPFLRNDSGPAKHLTPGTPTHTRSVPPEMISTMKTTPKPAPPPTPPPPAPKEEAVTSSQSKPEPKSDRRPIRYVSKGGVGGGGGGGVRGGGEGSAGGGGEGGGGGGEEGAGGGEGSRRSASRESSAGGVKRRVKVPKKRETETIYIIPETLPEDVLAKERIRRDTDFLMQGMVF